MSKAEVSKRFLELMEFVSELNQQENAQSIEEEIAICEEGLSLSYESFEKLFEKLSSVREV